MRKKYFRPKRIVLNESEPYSSMTFYLPKAMILKIKHYAEQLGLPMSRLICYAIDNELDQAKPFTYNTELPTTPYVPMKYQYQAGKVLKYISADKRGIGVDILLLIRDFFGLTRAEVLGAVRELLESDMVYWSEPHQPNLNPNYKVLKATVPETVVTIYGNTQGVLGEI